MSDEAYRILNEVYDLQDLNKEEQKKIQLLRTRINKHIGQIVVRSKQINIKEAKVRELIRR